MTVIPAALGESPSGHAVGVPYSPLYDDVYHAVAGAWAQARHVFIGGNGLPGRWRGRQRFVILETGFGLGNNFLATWAGWRQDPAACQHLVFISIEKHPLHQADMKRVHGLLDDASAASDSSDAHRELASHLVEAWPALTPGMHTLHFDEPEGRRITLMLGLGDIADLLPNLIAQVDAFYLDGFNPAKNPQMWSEHLLSRLHRLAAPGCTAATWSAARGVRDALAQAGFRVERAPGFAGKRDMVRAVYEPRFTPPPQAGGIWPEPSLSDRHAIVLGAGLAGCSAALALCREGWRVTLIDQHGGPAQEASGNPGGLFHSVLHGEDGVHARAHRAAALATWRQAQAWIKDGRLRGQADGLLRLDGKTTSEAACALLAKLGMPPDHVQWLGQPEAQTRSGLPVPSGGWLFHQAGWLHPAGLAKLMLEEAHALQGKGQALQCLWHRQIDTLKQTDDGQWQVLTADGRVAGHAPTLVLCNAMQASALLGKLPEEQATAPLPLSATRGQITEHELDPADASQAMPTLPVAGSGYVLPLSARTLLCGATTFHHDLDPSVREADHRHNLNQAARLGVMPALSDEQPLPEGLGGRTAWRAVTPDRLPLVGAVPLSLVRLQTSQGRSDKPRRLDQVRLIPRQRNAHGGLYALTGLGSRGITWCCLASELLSHWVTGSPCPVEADLRDALDPARFLVRQVTKAQ
ncbi:MAG: FAD-dependent 5-carboxymethylaminomethyl-2-thiouridine(34) oxidoreductase MnmC [Aquabacterium sp.]